MTSILSCPQCGAKLKKPQGATGIIRIQCPSCSAIFESAQEQPAAAPARSGMSAGRMILTGLAIFGVLGLLVAGSAAISFLLWPDMGHNHDDLIAAMQREQELAENEPLHPLALKNAEAFVDWGQNLEKAKETAAGESKNILIYFDGSDWNGGAMKMTDEAMARDEFQAQMRQKFVPVYIDSPRSAAAQARVESNRLNQQLKRHFLIDYLPMIVITDADGQPFVWERGYKGGGTGRYSSLLDDWLKRKDERDELLKKVAVAEHDEKLVEAGKAMEFLEDHNVAPFYDSLIEEWAALAEERDPENKDGYRELFFAHDMLGEIRKSAASRGQRAMAHLSPLDDWKKKYGFRNANLAAMLHWRAAGLLMMAGKEDDALRYIDEGIAYKPQNRELRRNLNQAAAALRWSSFGTGFVVAQGGYVLTNYHVVAGEGAVMVQREGDGQPVPAEIIASDRERDICLLKVGSEEIQKTSPLHIAAEHELRRGERAAVFGYPLGTAVGSGLKLTTGVVTATAEEDTNHMFILDARINPGNSGGPVCDESGNVVGMITAKSFANRRVESYGMALPAQDLANFLKSHVKDMTVSKAGQSKMQWAEVDKAVSPSVLMVLKAR